MKVAQMAESVDALVSNTSGAIRAGSIPALGTRKRVNVFLIKQLTLFYLKNAPHLHHIKEHFSSLLSAKM